MLMRVDVCGSGVAQGWQRCDKNDDEEQRSEQSDGHRVFRSGGTIENNTPTMFTGNVNA